MKLAALIALLLAGAAQAQAQDHASSEGYWKYHMPDGAKPFGNDDVVALAQGQHVETDCSVPWIGGDGNTYCFKDVASREVFLHAPMDYYRQAQRTLARERGDHPQSALDSNSTQENDRC